MTPADPAPIPDRAAGEALGLIGGSPQNRTKGTAQR